MSAGSSRSAQRVGAAKRIAGCIPLSVLLGGLALALLLAWILGQNGQRHRDQVVSIQTAALERTLLAGLDQRTRTLVRTARRWELSGGRERSDFDLEASVNIESYPAFRAIGWVDPDLIVRWVYPVEGNEEVVGFDNGREPQRRATLLAARAEGRLAILGPIDLVQGGRALLFFQPIGATNGQEQGYIYAAVDSEVMLRRVIGDVAADYAIAISVGGEPVFRRATKVSIETEPPSGTFTFDFGGVPWAVKAWAPPARLGLAELLPAVVAVLSLGLAGALRIALHGQIREFALIRAIRVGEGHRQAVFDNASVGMARVGFEGARFLEVNEALCRILGYSREELLATPWTAITHPEDLDLDLVPFRRMAAGELETYSVEKRFLHKDGRHLWTRLTLSLVRDADGRPDFEVCIVEDISERKAAADAVRASEDRLRRVLDQLFAFVGITDLDGRLIEANRAPLEAAGLRPEDVIGRPFWEAAWWSYDPEVQQRLRDAMARAAMGETVRYDVPIRVAGDDRATIDFQIAPLRDAEGRITHLVPSGIPVEERVRVQAELSQRLAQLDSVYRGVPVGLAFQDRDLRFTEVNEYMAGLNGLPVSAHTGRTPEELQPDIARIIVPIQRRVLDTGEPVVGVEMMSPAPAGGSPRAFLASYTPAHDASGQIVGLTTAVLDISGRKAAEDEVRHTRDLLQSTMDSALDPVFVKDREGHFVFVNTRLAELFGQPREAIVGRTDADFWPPDFAGRIMAADRAVMEAGVPRTVEEDVKEQGERRVLQSQIVPWRDAEGRVLGIIGFGRDITELKQKSAALEASEQRLTVAAEAAGFGTYDWDVVAERHIWTEEMYRIFGLPTGTGISTALLRSLVHADDMPLIERQLATTFTRGADLATEYRVVRPDGSIRYVVDRARVAYGASDEDRRPIRVIGAVRDVTEQREAEVAIRESERRYRTLIESIDAGFSLVELRFDGAMRPLDYVFVEVNPAFERQTGLVGTVGRSAREVIPGLEEHWFETYGRVAVTGQPVRFESGSEALGRWFDVYAVPVGDRAPYRVGILFNDITPRRRAEEEVRRLNRDLEALVEERTADLEVANRQLEAFAYTVSHDLRAPLRSMEGFAQILLEDFAEALGPKGQRHAERIASAAQRMGTLINDLLTFSRLQRAEIALRAFDPTDIARTAVNDAHALASPAGATIRIDEPLPAVAAEPVVMRHVLTNLLTNAVKFHPPDVRAEVRVHGEALGPRVRIWVEDNGIGIAPHHQARIFGTFERLHGQEAYPGTGIGLAIVKTGVERMGGTVGVVSAPGAGARFWVELAAPEATP